MQKNQQIPPRREVDVKARVTVSSMRAPAEEALVEVVELKPGLYVDRTLLPAENRNLKVCVLNTTTEAQTIATGTRLGNASSVVAVINGSENSDLATASYNNFLADIIEEAVKRRPDTVVDAKQKREVEELLQERRNLFSRGTYDKGRTDLVHHSIDTRQYDDNRQLFTSVSEDGNEQGALAPVGDDITAAGDEDRTTDPVDTMVRVGDVPAKIKGDVNGADVHVRCYPGSSTCGENVNGTRGCGDDKGEDGRDSLVTDERVGPRDIRSDATGHGKAGDGVSVGDD